MGRALRVAEHGLMLAALAVPAMWLVAMQARGAGECPPSESWLAMSLAAVSLAVGVALLRQGFHRG